MGGGALLVYLGSDGDGPAAAHGVGATQPLAEVGAALSQDEGAAAALPSVVAGPVWSAAADDDV